MNSKFTLDSPQSSNSFHFSILVLCHVHIVYALTTRLLDNLLLWAPSDACSEYLITFRKLMAYWNCFHFSFLPLFVDWSMAVPVSFAAGYGEKYFHSYLYPRPSYSTTPWRNLCELLFASNGLKLELLNNFSCSFNGSLPWNRINTQHTAFYYCFVVSFILISVLFKNGKLIS